MTTNNRPGRIDDLANRAIPPAAVRPAGTLTAPRSYGVYELPAAKATRRYRYGNHPVRMQELEAEHGPCRLLYLFLQREDAQAMATALNAGPGAS